MTAKTVHVYRADKGWAVKKEGARGHVFATQGEAIATARKMVRDSAPGQLAVHGKDGRIIDHRTYGWPRVQRPPRKSSLGTRNIERAVWKLVRSRLDPPRNGVVPTRLRHTDVFINCPFDPNYKRIFDAIVFAIFYLGFRARSALEVDDATENRLEKIERIIERCRYGIHDISAAGLDAATGLPRFNMPMELGLFLGCKRFGSDAQRKKACLILDSERYRYRNFISDISGQDIHSHGGRPEQAIVEVRNWLVSVSQRRRMPGGQAIAERYKRFLLELPALCTSMRRDPANLTFIDSSEMIAAWLLEAR
jgi:hypothetical protein